MKAFEIENEKAIMVIQSRIIDLTSKKINKTGDIHDIDKMLEWNRNLLFMMYEPEQLSKDCHLEN